jgi:hypothetical protein
MTKSGKEQMLNKIKQVIAGAEQFREDQFRMILEGLVKKGGREAEMLLVKYITLGDISVETRSKVIHSAGHIQSPLYLVPLKKVIDQDPNIYMKKAAVIAISGYKNQQALNILNGSLQTVTNPYLQNTINEQIDFIKKNNPLLALLPRFLKGDKDRKSFSVVLDILKKTLKPGDAGVFTNYLKSDDPSVRSGAFEILCFTGDRTIQAQVFEFFFQRMQQLQGDERVSLMKNIKQYFLRFPFLIFPQMSRLRSLYDEIKDKGAKKVLISIFCHCRAPEALSFIKEIYNNSGPNLREFIIEESIGNEQAVEFLFEKYRAGHILKEKILTALLNTRAGFTYFVQHFLTFDAPNQEMIVKNLPGELQPYMVDFIKTLFQSDLFHLKKILIKRVKQNFLFSLKEELFNPGKEKEFLSMKNDYLDTINSLFPITSIRRLLEIVALGDLEVPRVKDCMNRIINITRFEVAVNLKDSNLFPLLIDKIIKACSTELNEMFLRIFEHLKAFDMTTYKNFYDALYIFINQRGDNVVEEESLIIKRVKENFHHIVIDIKTIETLEKEIKLIFLKQVPDLIQLKKAMVSYHMGAAFKMKSLLRMFAEYFKTIDENRAANWKLLFKEFPLIMQLVREARTIINKKGEQYWNSFWDSYEKVRKTGETGKSFHDKLRIVVHFEGKQLTAFFKDQLEEVLPHFNIVVDVRRLTQTDILLCDSFILKNYIKRKALSTHRVFVLLENRSEFTHFKSLNLRAFFRPISIHRVLKLILQELYLLRSPVS